MPRTASPNPRSDVISFRLTAEQSQLLKTDFEADSAPMIKTPQMLARKILVDYLVGRLVYKNKEHRHANADIDAKENGNIQRRVSKRKTPAQ